MRYLMAVQLNKNLSTICAFDRSTSLAAELKAAFNARFRELL